LRPRSAELARIGLEADWEAVAVGVGVEGDDDGAGAGAGCCCSELAFLGLIDATGSATIAACEVTALRSAGTTVSDTGPGALAPCRTRSRPSTGATRRVWVGRDRRSLVAMAARRAAAIDAAL